MRVRVDFLGTPIDSVDMEESLQRVDEYVRTGKAHHVLVTNANKFWLMRRDPRLKGIAERADLILPERAIAVCSALVGRRLKGDVAGVAFAKELLPYCEKRGYSIYFLGAAAEVLQSMLETVHREYPGLKVAGYHHGYFIKDKNDAVLDDIRRKRPDVLLVAMGSPLQEYWIRESLDLERLSVPVSVGVGGSFVVIAGLKKDAPRWVRKSGFEWLFRLTQDPRNYWKRYARVVPFLMIAVLREGILGIRRSGKSTERRSAVCNLGSASPAAGQAEQGDR